MTDRLKDPFFDYHAHLKLLPDYVLRDIARNDCAERDYRRQAVEVLVVRKSSLANHPELADLKAELDVELDGLQFEYPAPEEAPAKNSGPLVASVTTATMFSDGHVPETEPDVPPAPADPVPPQPQRTRKPKEPVDASPAE
jgi:hypothetical protein